jgi:hypothetical protein
MVKVEYQSKQNKKEYVYIGDLVLIGDEPFLVTRFSGDEALLVNFEGCVWSEKTFIDGLSKQGLIDYVDDPNNDPIEIVKQPQFDVTITIK